MTDATPVESTRLPGDPAGDRTGVPAGWPSAPTVRFSFTVVYVPDLHQTLSFYREALGLLPRFVHESGRYTELATSGVTLAFSQDDLAMTALDDLPGGFTPNSPDSAPPGLDLAFVTAFPVDVVARAVRAGARLVSSLTEKPWGQRVAYLRDCNGLLFEIGTPIEREGVDGQ